ncbi:50S ribosomal protein L9 [Thalassobaculum fulvum]|uniref:Large ribosomal subunit protein bL9 n=1 Tax=Thalassobaculum fulvum TaxID=1633335 RepID=A0A918XRD7_9PROT|nr:50S ribosomal protein L9 [Thalassobaculum fulvum]GHD49714.1 50S ribosomal protein L9 [Thalassobaculum fulvum]
MEVILLERIESLGQMGEVVKVKAGFARNFLLPQKKALRATDANRKVFEERRVQLEAENLERKSEAEKVAGTLDGLSVVLVRAASETGQLYGSVTARDVAESITAAGVTVGRSQVRLDKALKQLGLEPVRVQLHPEVAVSVTVNIARSQEEAETQAKLGRALDREAMEDEFERADAAAEAASEAGAAASETEGEKAAEA